MRATAPATSPVAAVTSSRTTRSGVAMTRAGGGAVLTGAMGSVSALNVTLEVLGEGARCTAMGDIR
jgi:hypothetical protein